MYPFNSSILPGFPAVYLGELFGRLWVRIRPRSALPTASLHLPLAGRTFPAFPVVPARTT